MKTAVNLLAGVAAFILIVIFRQPIYQILNVVAGILPPGLR